MHLGNKQVLLFIRPMLHYPHEQVNPHRGQLSAHGDRAGRAAPLARLPPLQLAPQSAPGFPDLTMVRRGKLVFAELKTEKGNLTKAQAWWLAGLKQAHPHVYLWRPSDWREIEEVLR